MKRVLHVGATPEALGFARFAVYSIWFVVILMHPIQGFSALPQGWHDAVGPLRLLPDEALAVLLSANALWALRLVLLVLCALLALGIRPFMPLAIPCAVLLLLFDAIIKGYGSFVNHAQAAALVAAWVLALFPAADGFSVMGARKKPAPSALYASPLLFTGLCLASIYMLLGIRRFAHGGYEIFTGEAILRYFSVSSLNYSKYGFDHGLVFLDHPLLGIAAKLGFFFVTVAELTTPLALFHRGYRWAWLLVMIPMHIGTLFLMNILFWEQMILALVFMTGLPHVVASWKFGKGKPGTLGEAASPPSAPSV